MSQDNININVTENIDEVNIVASEIVEVVDLNLYATTEDVTINVTEDIIQVNINKVTSSNVTKTSDLINDGTDGTSTYVETNELGAAAFSNDYNDLDNLPTIPEEITKTSDLLNDGSDGVNKFITLQDIPAPITIDAVPTDGSSNAVSSNGVFDALATKQNTLTNPVTGTGANGQVAFWNGTNSQTGDNGFFWDNTNRRLGIGTTSPAYGISHIGSIGVASFFSQRDFGANALSQLTQRASFIGYTFNDGTNGIATGANGAGAYIQGFTGTLANPSAKQIVLQSFGGNVAIGATTAGARLDVRAQGALSTDIAFRVRNSADTADSFQVNGLGNTTIVSANPILNINVTGIAQTSFLYFNAPDGTPRAGIVSNIATGEIRYLATSGGYFPTFYSNGSERMRIPTTGNLLIGTTTDAASAILNVSSTTKGFLPPRMTNAQRLAIASPAVGLMVYCTDVVEGLYVNKSTGWQFII